MVSPASVWRALSSRSAVEGAFDPGVMAAESFEFCEGCGGGFQGADAAEIPGVVRQLLENGFLERAFRLGISAELFAQMLEFGAIFGRED